MLIHQPIIAGETAGKIAAAVGISFFRGEGRVRQKAQNPQPIVDGDDDDAVLHERRGIVVVALSIDQRSSVDPHHHGAQLAYAATGIRLRSEHVEEQAIFGGGGNAKGRGRLRAVIGELGGIERLEPRCVRHRRAPAQIADGRGGVGNAEEFADSGGSHCAADRAAESESQWISSLCERISRHAAQHHRSREYQKHGNFELTLIRKGHRDLRDVMNPRPFAAP